jgi:redox-sensitive bicupin YhaK (pirin superfamily)
MTAAGGIVHEEMHSRRFTEQGGDMEMVQLWVNLPAKHKLGKPGYQALLDKDFPRVTLGAARARLIAGALGSHKGPAFTHTPMTVLDLTFGESGDAELELPAGFTALLFTLEGELRSAEQAQSLTAGSLATLARGDSGLLKLQGAAGARALVLAGEPIDEPVAAYGPFVMNTQEQILDAIRDYQSGKMGHLS